MTDVTDRTGRIRSVSNGLKPEYPIAKSLADMNMKKAAQTFLLCTGLLYSTVPAQSAVTEFVVPSGPMITLQGDRTLEGHVIRIDQTDIVIQTGDGTTRTVPRSIIETVAFETITGQQLVGELVGWTPGVYQIATSEAAIKVYSSVPAIAARPDADLDPEDITFGNNSGADDIAEITSEIQDVGQDDSPTIIAATTTSEMADNNDAADNAEIVPEPRDASQAYAAALAAATTTDETTSPVTSDLPDGLAGAQPDDLAGSQTAATTPTADLSIEVSVENSRENGPPVAFNIQLSKPPESSVVLIYATIDGTAVNGEDYEASRGVVVIKPGEQSARIEAHVINDQELEEQEHLQLFLTVDPSVAVIENRQIIATIDDDDQG